MLVENLIWYCLYDYEMIMYWSEKELHIKEIPTYVTFEKLDTAMPAHMYVKFVWPAEFFPTFFTLEWPFSSMPSIVSLEVFKDSCSVSIKKPIQIHSSSLSTMKTLNNVNTLFKYNIHNIMCSSPQCNGHRWGQNI